MIAILTNSLDVARRYMEADRKARFYATQKGYLPGGIGFEILWLPGQARGRKGFTGYQIFLVSGPTGNVTEMRRIMESIGVPHTGDY